MKESTFQYTVLGLLAAILLIAFIGLFTKKKKDQYGTSISVAGKTVYENKDLKANLKKADEDTKNTIAQAHGLKMKKAS